jgi:hypothetical protein
VLADCASAGLDTHATLATCLINRIFVLLDDAEVIDLRSFRRATGLTQEQVDRARGDEETRLLRA